MIEPIRTTQPTALAPAPDAPRAGVDAGAAWTGPQEVPTPTASRPARTMLGPVASGPTPTMFSPTADGPALTMLGPVASGPTCAGGSCALPAGDGFR